MRCKIQIYIVLHTLIHLLTYLEVEKDWELVSSDSATAAPAFGQLYIRIVEAHIDIPHGVSLGSLRADVALTQIQGLAASGSTNSIFNTNQPHVC
jgi:hypothetical protein